MVSPNTTSIRDVISQAYRQDETEIVTHLLNTIDLSEAAKQRIQVQASKLVIGVRKERHGKSGIDTLMREYNLSNEEGIALMCIAEALLRIPDSETRDKLIRDKLATADWEAHLGNSESIFINAATWGLMLTGKIYNPGTSKENILIKSLRNFLQRSSEPVIRGAILHAMRILGKQFVMGRTIQEALADAKAHEKQGYLYSYDMLGEAAKTQQAADIYFHAYHTAIQEIAKITKTSNLRKNPAISVKLSALHPRYEFSQKSRVITDVSARLKALCLQASKANIGLTVDAEEADRLDLSLDILENVFGDPELQTWQGLGIALQSYQKRAWFVIDWLIELAIKHKKIWQVRLMKGAYWDTEIKLAQQLGLEGYPVFTRKMNTDVAFLSCAQKILQYPQHIFPQFATHNAHNVAAILEMVGNYKDFEFQCLHGMGKALYDQIVGSDEMGHSCRIYAPVGSHEDLLPYLVRRLLENGANTSFVNRIIDEKLPVSEIVADPINKVKSLKSISHPHIPLPRFLYGQERLNSIGLDLSNYQVMSNLQKALQDFSSKVYHAKATFTKRNDGQKKQVINPMNAEAIVGTMTPASPEEINLALEIATKAAFNWDQTPVKTRANYLQKTADLFEQHQAELIALIIREGGKTIPDALAEVREAVDFCRYYAIQALTYLAEPQILPGPTGETNQLQLHGRGPMVCISPWNFPLAIFTGQVAAALVVGNPVMAKPAEPTPLIASRAVDLFHQAGIPKEILHYLPAAGSMISKHLIPDPRLKGVVFTGSSATAQVINQTLAQRSDQIIPLIAETGGQNAMIVDSSALPEQVVTDVITSIFLSAGQRCSALRVLFLQEEIADKIIGMLMGAMQELIIGDPLLLATDIGPVINEAAKIALLKHKERMLKEGKLLCALEVPNAFAKGSYFAPCAFEIPSLKLLTAEVFGPILHVIRYKANALDEVVDDINNTGYGLTLGIHSRISSTYEYIHQRIRAGNCYVNRNMVGAVVGVQPFGGEGLSGTGPKAGGPYYLPRLCVERTLSINVAAAGGNASLMTLRDELDLSTP